MTNNNGNTNIRIRKTGHIIILELNRPHKANAYSEAMLNEIDAQLHTFNSSDQSKVIIITGAGDNAFCGGADLNELKEKTFESALDLKSAAVFGRLSSLNKITIAAINGAAYGGGLELALSCDIRICSENATFAFPEINHGLIPAAGGTQRLAEITSKGKAKELILGGYIWKSQDAISTGLVSQVISSDRLLQEALSLAERIASKNSLALRLAKQAIDSASSSVAAQRLEKVSEALLYELKNKR